MEVNPVDQTPSSKTEQPAPAPCQVTIPTYSNALYTIGSYAGWGLWKCTSFVISKSFQLVWRCIFKTQPHVSSVGLENFVEVKKIHKTFKKDPYSVIMKILDYLERDPPTDAQKILCMLAEDCHRNRGTYIQNENMKERKEWITKIDAIVTSCILSPKQREVYNKVLKGKASNAEFAALNEKNWEKNHLKYSEEAQEFRRIYEEAKDCKEEFAALWAVLAVGLTEEFPYLQLDEENQLVNPVGNEGLTFGVFLERLLYHMDESERSSYKLVNLKDREFFDSLADYVIEKLQFVKSEKIPASIDTFCNQFIRILQSKRDKLFEITCAVIRILRPEKASSKAK